MLDGHQADVLHGALGESDDEYRWLTGDVAVIEPRQNGKGAILEARALAGLFLFKEPLILWTAHEFKTAREHFLRFRQMVDNFDHLRRKVRQVRVAAGEEGVELLDGSRLRFLARSGGSGRGFSAPTVFLDEAYALTDEQMAALQPTLVAQPNPQVWYMSSAPLDTSTVLRRLCRRGRGGTDPLFAYFEWCAADDAASDDRRAWADANPALGGRISVESVARELGSMDEADFRREQLGIVDLRDGTEQVVSPDAWTSCADPASRPGDPVALSVDVTPDRVWTSIACAGRREDGLGHGELVEHRRGTGWVVDRLVALAERHCPCVLALDPSGPAGSLVAALAEAGFQPNPGPDDRQLMLVGAREHAQACGALVDDISNDRWRHLDQPELNNALAGARTRPLADAWAWSRRSSAVDISPLVAVTLARHGFAVFGPVDNMPAIY